MATRIAATERFWPKVDKDSDPNGCWLWTGALNDKGYGVFRVHHDKGKPGQFKRAHVFAYEEKFGPVPEGTEIDHIWKNGCRNKNCVNIEAHLEAVTHHENVQRSKWVRENFCRRLHTRTPENTKRNKDGYRICLDCRAENNAARREKTRRNREQREAEEARVRREADQAERLRRRKRIRQGDGDSPATHDRDRRAVLPAFA